MTPPKIQPTPNRTALTVIRDAVVAAAPQSSRTTNASPPDTFERGGGGGGRAFANFTGGGFANRVSDTISTKLVVRQAEGAGLSTTEAAKLEGDLAAMTPEQRRAQVKFLRDDVIGTPNADRALRTYNELHDVQAEPGNAERLTDGHIEDLTRAVAQPATAHADGTEGVMGQTQAVEAGRTLTEVDQATYDSIDAKLGAAESPTERALVLKATAARHDALTGTDSEAKDAALGDVTRFADEIRGVPRASLIERTTPIDLDGDGDDEGLVQRYTDSCVPTTAQAVAGARDPIFAWDHDGLRGTEDDRMNPYDDVGMQQRTVLEDQGGDARPRGTPGSYEVPMEAHVWAGADGTPHTVEVPGSAATTAQTNDMIERLKEDFVGDPELGIGIHRNKVDDALQAVTGDAYDRTGVAGSATKKQAAVDDAATRLERGEDVVIGVDWASGGRHAMLLTDVRGEAGSRQFQVYDPGSGGTSWLDESELTGKTGTYKGTSFELTQVWTPKS